MFGCFKFKHQRRRINLLATSLYLSGPRKSHRSLFNRCVTLRLQRTTLFFHLARRSSRLFMEDVAPNQRAIHNELFHQERRRSLFISRSRSDVRNTPIKCHCTTVSLLLCRDFILAIWQNNLRLNCEIKFNGKYC